MLAVAGGDANLENLKMLMNSKADLTVLDFNGNNLIHIAAKYQSNKLLKYLVDNTRINVFERNK
jgi:ankyrin repeat protein